MSEYERSNNDSKQCETALFSKKSTIRRCSQLSIMGFFHLLRRAYIMDVLLDIQNQIRI